MAWSLAVVLTGGALACSIDDRTLTARSDAGTGGTTTVAAPDSVGAGGTGGATATRTDAAGSDAEGR